MLAAVLFLHRTFEVLLTVLQAQVVLERRAIGAIDGCVTAPELPGEATSVVAVKTGER